MADISKIKIGNTVYNIDDAAATTYGSCTTAAATVKKVITLQDATNWHLKTGSIILVKFSYTNTASNPTFNVNNSGDKPVWFNTAKITSTNLPYAGTANRPMEFIYDGTNWVFAGWSYDSNSTYSVMTGATSTVAGKQGLVPVPAAGKQTAFLRGDGTWNVPVNTDINVKQSGSTTTSFRPIILGYNSSQDPTSLSSETTNSVFQTTNLYVQPSTGDLHTDGDFYSNGKLCLKTGVRGENGSPEGTDYTTLIEHSGANLWIGGSSTVHHLGNTYISTGYNDSTKKGNETAKLLVPNETNNDYTSYDILHTGNYSTYTKKKQRCIVGHADETSDNSKVWFKFATCKMPEIKTYDSEISFYVSTSYGTLGKTGILTAHVRQGETIGTIDNAQLIWNLNGDSSYFMPKNFVLIYNNGDTTGATVELWVNSPYVYHMLHFDVIQQETRNNWNEHWTLHDRPTPLASLPSGYTQVESVINNEMLLLTGGTMTGTIKYNTGTKTSDLFMVDDGNEQGSMYSAPFTGGLTIIGGGNSARNMRNRILSVDGLFIPDSTTTKFQPINKHLILSSDNYIYFTTNCNIFDNRKNMILTPSLTLMPETNDTGSIGNNTHCWHSAYITATTALASDKRTVLYSSGLKFVPNTTSTWIGAFNYRDSEDKNTICSIGAYGNANTAQYVYMGGTYDSPWLKVIGKDGTTTEIGNSISIVGNDIAEGSTGNRRGYVRLYDTGKLFGTIKTPDNYTESRIYMLPDTSGTIALTTSNITGTSAGWTTARNINGMSINGSANRTNYGTCSTAAGTVAKTVSCTGFALILGAEITVKFTTTNTANSPTLNVNNTGAKPIYYRGASINKDLLSANKVYTFRYNGTQYELVGDASSNIKLLYNGSGSNSVTLTEDTNNFDLIIIEADITNSPGLTFLHYVGNTYTRHPYVLTPNPSDTGGAKNTDVGSVLTRIQTNTVYALVSETIIEGSTQAATPTVVANVHSQSISIKKVYGIKFAVI